ncbi:site-specific DNA-methyltransferase [Streptomyces sp. NPDC006610]|uniref:DNA-methyltransferase n=1 Tax=Streptomyces sp. NPDC006610 TaxID=3154584 RepID=UPI0033A27F5E
MSQPYYADDAVTLYVGDCRDILPSLTERPDSCVTDPPYGETAAEWDRWPDGWVDAVAAVLPPSASLWCFGSARMFLEHAADFTGWRFAQEALWVKRNGSGPGSRDRLVKLHEWAYHWYRGKWSDLHHEWERERTTANRGSVRKASRSAEHQRDGRATTWVDDGMRQPRSVTYVVETPSVRYRKRHQDEKPLAVVEPLVRECTPPGGLVLDPMAGSGTTLEAAVACGRRAVGIEKDERSAEMIVMRLAQMGLAV